MDVVLAPSLPKLMISDTQQVQVKDTAGNDVPGSPGIARATTQYSGYIELASP